MKIQAFQTPISNAGIADIIHPPTKYIEFEHVIGVKESHFNITQYSQTLRLVGDKIF